MKDMKLCQSCGMPMGKENKDLYGTNSDGSKNDENCIYCFENGKYKSELTMQQMKEICVMHMVRENNEMTEEEAKRIMDECLPKLKRWQ